MNISEIDTISLKKEKWYSSDDTVLFLAFESRTSAKVHLWGKELPFLVSIQPAPHKIEYRAVKLTASRQKMYDTCIADKMKLEAMLLPPPCEEDYAKYCNVDAMEAALKEIVEARTRADSAASITAKIGKLIEDIQAIDLPPQLTRIDCRFGEFLKTAARQMLKILMRPCDDIEDAVTSLSSVAYERISSLEEGYGRLAGVPRAMTEAEAAERKAWETAFVSSSDFDERIEILCKQWSDELVSPLDRLVHIRHALSAFDKNMKKAVVPASLNQPSAHLAEIRRALEIAETQGLDFWQKRMASAFITAARDWAPDDVSPETITLESFALSITPCEVAISTEETEAGISCSSTFAFKDANDFLSGHTMYAVSTDSVLNNQVFEYHL